MAVPKGLRKPSKTDYLELSWQLKSMCRTKISKLPNHIWRAEGADIWKEAARIRRHIIKANGEWHDGTQAAAQVRIRHWETARKKARAMATDITDLALDGYVSEDSLEAMMAVLSPLIDSLSGIIKSDKDRIKN